LEVTDLHKEILVKIHDSEKENINKSRFAEIKLDYPDLEKTIAELESLELVEFEINENSYYLTYEGYELVEKIKNPPKVKKVRRKSNAEEYNDIVEVFGGVKNFHRFVIILISIVAIMFGILFYLDSTY